MKNDVVLPEAALGAISMAIDASDGADTAVVLISRILGIADVESETASDASTAVLLQAIRDVGANFVVPS